MGLLQFDRRNFFENVGSKVESTDLKEILQQAKLDYVVSKEPVFLENNERLDKYWATRATIDGKDVTLGIVGPQYTVLQNYEAFDFLKDMFVDGDLQIACAGTVSGGRKSFICAKTDPIKVMDDDIDPYIVIMNSFDGSGSVKVLFTPVRVFCSNCEVIATKAASQKLYIKHSAQVHSNLYIGKDVLLRNTEYLKEYKQEMEDLAKMRYNRRQFADNLTKALLEHMDLICTEKNAKWRKKDSALVDKYTDELLYCWSMNDLGNYANTAYAAFQAIADWETHYLPGRDTNNNELFFTRAINGMVLSNWCLNYIKQTSV